MHRLAMRIARMEIERLIRPPLGFLPDSVYNSTPVLCQGISQQSRWRKSNAIVILQGSVAAATWRSWASFGQYAITTSFWFRRRHRHMYARRVRHANRHRPFRASVLAPGSGAASVLRQIWVSVLAWL